ncbi:MAG: prepilin-type N-terminal cleavage/methylation domain-containing protein [Armatimonadetes bacterium]|nr:prepilin-type N-terminal cleavage/methylation domain-containing protein [Armatimonadota bacterium]
MMRREKRARREDGFSLLEVMMAMVILLIALLGIFGLLNSGVLMNQDTMSTSQAADFAHKRLETVRNTPFAGVGTKGSAIGLATGLASDDGRADADLTNLGLANATWDRQVVVVPNPTYYSGSAVKRVTVTVDWGPANARRQMRLITYVSRTGLNSTSRSIEPTI